MTKPNWMIYGAYGYTGRLLAEEALRRGHRPLLAGRSRAQLEPLAKQLGLPSVAVSLDDTEGLSRALEGIEVVMHAAGPFVHTSEPMIRACLQRGASYLDVTGEVPVFANTFTHDAEARQRGVLLMSGVGFDVVPTDCLAKYVASKLPGATELELAICGLSKLSAGTLKSMFEAGLSGALMRRDGQLVTRPFGQGARDIRFDHGMRSVMPIPWGDLETAYRSTGIANITIYMAFPRQLVALSKASSPLTAALLPGLKSLVGKGPLKRAIDNRLSRVQGPDEHERERGHAHVWACARDASGNQHEAWLRTMDGYAFTAVAGVRIVERVLSARPTARPKGALTPAQAFGADFVLDIEGTQRFDALPTSKVA